MKKGCILSSLILISSFITSCAPPVEEHLHTFSSTYKYDETNHWHEATCEHSQFTLDLEAHTFNDQNVCKCGYTKVIPHVHTFEENYLYDENYHYKKATCEHTYLTDGLEAHTFNEENKCNICGYRKHNFSLVGNLVSITPSEFVSSLLPESIKDASDMINILMNAFISMAFGEDGELILLRQSFEYESISYDGKPITLSGAFTIPCFNNEITINFIDIDSHPTFSDKSEAVSYGPDIYSILSIVGALTIEFDLIGFGSSYYLPADYHCRHSLIQTYVDGLIAANYLLKENFDISITEYPQILTGYSQGGYDAMAFLRYLETEANDDFKSIVDPIATFCGSGAYDLKVMIDESLSNSEFMYPEYILMGIITAKYYHPELFGDHQIEEFLTEYGRKFIDPIIAKDDAAIQALKLEKDINGDPIYQGPSDFFSEEFLVGDKGQELQQIVEAYYSEENLLDGKWVPEGKLYLYYSEDDEMVTPKCSEKAEQLFGELENVEIESGYDDHRTFALSYYLSLIGTTFELLGIE